MGLARVDVASDITGDGDLTGSGMALRTLDYMASEQTGDRYQTMEEVIAALDAIKHDLLQPDRRGPQARQPLARRQPWPWQ